MQFYFKMPGLDVYASGSSIEVFIFTIVVLSGVLLIVSVLADMIADAVGSIRAWRHRRRELP